MHPLPQLLLVPRPDRPRAGWTLIELLLATVTALLVLTILIGAYHTVLSATRGQQARLRAGELGDTLLSLSRDLQCAFQSGQASNTLLGLRTGDGFELSLCTLVPTEAETDLRWSDLVRVTYRVETNGPGRSLVRIHAPLVGPGAYSPPVTNRILEGFAAAEVLFADGNDWVDGWPVDDSGTLPRAARLALTPPPGSGRRPLETEVFLPVGSSVLSEGTPDAPAPP